VVVNDHALGIGRAAGTVGKSLDPGRDQAVQDYVQYWDSGRDQGGVRVLGPVDFAVLVVVKRAGRVRARLPRRRHHRANGGKATIAVRELRARLAASHASHPVHNPFESRVAEPLRRLGARPGVQNRPAANAIAGFPRQWTVRRGYDHGESQQPRSQASSMHHAQPPSEMNSDRPSRV
jgi:hypothetical protein